MSKIGSTVENRICRLNQSHALIFTDDNMLVSLLSDAAENLQLFSNVKIVDNKHNTAVLDVSKVALVILAMDNLNDNFDIFRNLRGQELLVDQNESGTDNITYVLCHFKLNTNDKSSSLKLGIHAFIERPFLSDTVVEVLLRALKL